MLIPHFCWHVTEEETWLLVCGVPLWCIFATWCRIYFATCEIPTAVLVWLKPSGMWTKSMASHPTGLQSSVSTLCHSTYTQAQNKINIALQSTGRGSVELKSSGAIYNAKQDRQSMYKVVQIWPGLFVCKQVTVCPGHIWTTLYIPKLSELFFINIPIWKRESPYIRDYNVFLGAGHLRKSGAWPNPISQVRSLTKFSNDHITCTCSSDCN